MKTKKKTSLVFFGSGPVAAESLRLLKQDFDIEAVITKTTTKSEMESVVSGTRIITVENRHSLDLVFEKEIFNSELAILIDFGIIVSNKVIDYFPRGIINSHFSLLPELRGADPISFAILEGKKKTGVSLMLLVEAMDEGPILAVGMFDLDGSETTPTLTKELIQLSYKLLNENIPKYLDGEIELVDQEIVKNKFKLETSYTRKLVKQDGVIDWNKNAEVIEREIRAYSGWPKSRTSISNIDCIITKAHIQKESGNAGSIFVYDKKLGVYCGRDAIIIDLIKPAGKKEMDATAFLAGYKDRLEI